MARKKTSKNRREILDIVFKKNKTEVIINYFPHEKVYWVRKIQRKKGGVIATLKETSTRGLNKALKLAKEWLGVGGGRGKKKKKKA